MSDDGGGGHSGQDYGEDSPLTITSPPAAKGPAVIGGGGGNAGGGKRGAVIGGGDMNKDGFKDIALGDLGGGGDDVNIDGFKDIALGGFGGGGNDYATWTDENGVQRQSNKPRCRQEIGPNGDVIGESCVL
jgi:hypothetical protein